MSDLIERQAAINAICKTSCGAGCGMPCDEIFALEELPSAQPDIIACGDCKHWINHDRRCGFWNHGVKPLDWCSRGEKR